MAQLVSHRGKNVDGWGFEGSQPDDDGHVRAVTMTGLFRQLKEVSSSLVAILETCKRIGGIFLKIVKFFVRSLLLSDALFTVRP